MSKPTNISSVPHRSPFRYPGGKTWFVPTFRKWVENIPYRHDILIEPFVGGGIISLTAIFENLVDRVIIAELDDDVAAVWSAIVNGDSEYLADRILEFDFNKGNLIRILNTNATTICERAFQTIVKNRIGYGGIIANCAGLINKGESGKGIGSRWYPETLAKRFRDISRIAEKITFKHGDGLSVIEQHISSTNTIFFIDPPYTIGGKRAGRRLYKHNELDHHQLFRLCSEVQGEFLMTYDDTTEARALANKYHFEVATVQMRSGHHAKMKELVISKNLSWMKEIVPK